MKAINKVASIITHKPIFISMNCPYLFKNSNITELEKLST